MEKPGARGPVSISFKYLIPLHPVISARQRVAKAPVEKIPLGGVTEESLEAAPTGRTS